MLKSNYYLTYLPEVWKKFDKIHPVRSRFFDDAKEEENTTFDGPMQISIWACGFVILLALFGLLGMVTYTTEIKVKEIGIRKAFGASIASVTCLLSGGYVKLILYTAIFALPCGYFITASMMQFFAIRPDLNLLVPFGALGFILVLALIIIGSQTVRASLENPIDILREE